MEAKLLAIEVTITAPDGVVDTYTRAYSRDGEEGSDARYLPADPVTGERSGYCAYVGFESDAAFEAAEKAQIAAMLQSRYRARQTAREQEQRRNQYDGQHHPAILRILAGLQGADDIDRLLGNAAVWHDANEGIASVIAMPPKKARAVLRAIYAEAREYVRSEYPAEYREEESKDDFYAAHDDDMAAYMAGAL